MRIRAGLKGSSAVTIAVSDAVSQVLQTALNGLNARQNLIAQDIANVDTPHYRAHSMDFENSLKAAIARGEFNDEHTGPGANVTITQSLDRTAVGADGNNVDLRKKMIASIQTQYSYQVVARAFSDHLGLLKTAAVEAR